MTSCQSLSCFPRQLDQDVRGGGGAGSLFIPWDALHG
jgi:hypothetical protein